MRLIIWDSGSDLSPNLGLSLNLKIRSLGFKSLVKIRTQNFSLSPFNKINDMLRFSFFVKKTFLFLAIWLRVKSRILTVKLLRWIFVDYRQNESYLKRISKFRLLFLSSKLFTFNVTRLFFPHRNMNKMTFSKKKDFF